LRCKREIIMAEKRKHVEAELTDEEKARYDRQIRVWGSEAQSRIQGARVLVCGLHGLHMELIKNIVLAGMSICVQDSGVVNVAELGSGGYFLDMDDISKNRVLAALPRIQELNSFASVTSETRPLAQLDADFLRQFNVVCLANASEREILRVSGLCRRSSPSHTTFFAGWSFGSESVFISDFGENFQYKDDDRPNTDFVPTVKKISFPAVETVLSMPWSKQSKRFMPVAPAFVKSALLAKWDSSSSSSSSSGDGFRDMAALALEENGLSSQFIPAEQLAALLRQAQAPAVTVCSIMGSYLAQEVVKCVSGVGEPAFNTHIYNSEDGTVSVYPMCPSMEAPDMRDKVVADTLTDFAGV
jgi:ubiquitin-like 1-activating enzyme E1 A